MQFWILKKREIINLLIGKKFSAIILKQDKNVVKTQPNEATYIGMPEEKLIQGDMPIIIYRKHREELKKRNIKN